jgi:hypothetical protein
MKVIDKIIVSPTAPKNKNAAWFDGKSIKMSSQGKWESARGSGGGIEIVESVDKLDPNAPVGSLASVAVPSKITEVSVRDMQQPDTSIINQETGAIDTSTLSRVQSISIDPNKVSFDGRDSMLYFCSENTNINEGGIMLAVTTQFQGVSHMQIGMSINTATMEQKQYVFIQEAADRTTDYQDQIDEFIKQFEQNTFYYLGFFEHMSAGVEITEEDYVSLDNIKVVSGTSSVVDVYKKGDTWEMLTIKDSKDLEPLIKDLKKETDELQDSIDDVYVNMRGKSDVILINSYSSNGSALPNAYTTYTINTTGNVNIKLRSVPNSNTYNEYIIEITCTSTPSEVNFVNSYGTKININWSNDNAPIFETGYTYIISIVNNFGVFATFTNS